MDVTVDRTDELAVEVDSEAQGILVDEQPNEEEADLDPDAEDQYLDSASEGGSEYSYAESSIGERFILEEHYENGRRYANETYFLPNDDAEETRLNIVHQIYLQLLRGELTVTRIGKDVERILDLGAGPGDWAIAMAEKYPNAEVIATDITAYRMTNLPPNVTFQIDDCANEWTYGVPFDIIHMRDLNSAVGDWDHVFTEARKHLKLDGKLEITNISGFKLQANSDQSYVALYNELFWKACDISGRVWADAIPRQELEKAGLKVVKRMIMNVPLGMWEQDLKKKVLVKMGLVAVLESLEACALRPFTQFLEWSAEQVRDLCEKVKAEVLDEKNKAVFTVEFVVARRMPDMPAY